MQKKYFLKIDYFWFTSTFLSNLVLFSIFMFLFDELSVGKILTISKCLKNQLWNLQDRRLMEC